MKNCLALACAFAALLCTPALGQVNGSIAGEYTNLSGSGVSGNSYGFTGVVQLPLTGGFAVQADGGYHAIVNHGTTNFWNIGGVGGWGTEDWRLAANVRYYDFSRNSFSDNFTTFGGGGEYYLGGASKDWTIGLNGGGITGTESGGYVGGSVAYYPCPQFTGSVGINYTSFNSSDHQTNFTVQSQYIPVRDWPFSLWGGYTYADYAGGDHAHIFNVGLKVWLDGDGGPPDLKRYERTQQFGWIGTGPGAFAVNY
jgi:hypothetical protein